MRKTTFTILGAIALAGAAACGDGGDAADGTADEAETMTADEGETMTTESGLEYQVLREGDGARPAMADSVVVHYRGTLTDGTEFDSSYGRGEPATFSVGGLIPGFTETLLMMQVGSHYRVTIPPELGYGEAGGGSIPPNATLVFELELLDVIEM